MTTAEQERYTAHAAQCDSCGPVLREVVEDFSEPMTEEEEAILGRLQASNRKWQPAIANPDTSSDLEPESSWAPQPVIPQRRWLGFPRWQVSAATLVICAGIAFSLFRFGVFDNKDTVASVDQLLAKAYTEHRTMELRIPGAYYAPSQVTLGATESHLNRAVLLDAEAKLARQLERTPSDPQWLDAKGRAALLDGDFDSAVDALQRAAQLDAESTSIQTDLATAYFERGAKNNFAPDYGASADLLGKVLQKSPEDPIALFNRALIYERQTLFPEAVVDWESYLRVDPNSGWADEARSHLKKLQQKISEHQNSVLHLLAEPEVFVRLLESHNAEAVNQIDQRIEEYQDHAIREWLPRRVANDDKDAAIVLTALQYLADLLLEKHKDRWFKDLLDEPQSTRFRSGLLHLGSALSASAYDDPTKARAEAQAAADDFTNTLSQTGESRAELEEVHVLRRAQEGDVCLEKANALAESLRGREYPWLLAQLNIDRASCALMLGKFDLADSYVASARKLALTHRYRDLELRSTGVAAGARRDEGDLMAAWAEDQAGLWQYWTNGFVPPIRAQLFYDDLSYLAESAGEWRSAVGFAQESARMLALSRRPKTEALARQHLARIAVHASNFGLAADQLEKSNRILEDNKQPKADQLYGEIALGEIEIEMGKLDDAQTRLSSIALEIQGIRSFTIPQQFYAVRGNLLLKQHRELEAEDTLLNGADVADRNAKEISGLSDRYFWSQESSHLYRSLVYLEFIKGDRERAFSAWEWYKAGSLERSRGGPDSLRAFWRNDGLRDSLSSLVGRIVISYTLLPQGLVIWAADHQGVESYITSIDAEQLASWIAEFYALCSDKDSNISTIQSRGRRLFDLLIAPVAHRLHPNQVLIIESDDMLGDIPFQALVTPENRYFGQIYQIAFSAGLLYSNFLRTASPIVAGSSALVVGSTANVAGADISLLPAPEVLDQAQDVAARFTDPKRLKGIEATAQAMEKILPRVEVFHFVGHAVSSLNKEGILLFSASPDASEGAILWEAQPTSRRLFQRAKLVVLAACSTGRTYRGRMGKHGELVHSILLAGVPHVIASRWDVSATATRSFMNSFYSALLSGNPVLTSMQFASSSVFANPDLQHPFYWAAFAAFGRS